MTVMTHDDVALRTQDLLAHNALLFIISFLPPQSTSKTSNNKIYQMLKK